MTKKAKKLHSSKSFKGLASYWKDHSCKSLQEKYEGLKQDCYFLSNPYIKSSNPSRVTQVCMEAGKLQKKLREKGCKR